MKISRNESTTDRVIRFVAAIALLAIALSGVVTAPWTYLIGAVAVILGFTAITGFCAIYALFGLSSKAAQ